MDVRNLFKRDLHRRAGGGGGGAEGIGYVPPPSVGHEIGVMFGGIGLMLLGMLLFWSWWQIYLKQEEKKERKRVEDLRQRGLLKEQWNGSTNSNENGDEKAVR
ncbi:hypothetical protein GTA08_BOTSDO10915 [Neofusicoccum parvum]|uniref:Uncharacterized protein n=1 Tax=Neofusicoccum parvum TaxID=310453 RepID=A0ACB5SQ58_9PEZI|nr:hypothetical protein GTA08_BOTSDO10915 [Neofusicoccum parvum]